MENFEDVIEYYANEALDNDMTLDSIEMSEKTLDDVSSQYFPKNTINNTRKVDRRIAEFVTSAGNVKANINKNLKYSKMQLNYIKEVNL